MSSQKYVFLAGGMGITPFRSISKQRLDKKEDLSAFLFHFATKAQELLFEDLFKEASQQIGLVYIPVITTPDTQWSGQTGKFSETLLKNNVPVWKEAIYYLSGSEQFIQAVREVLYTVGIKDEQIRTDVFTGY